MAWELPGLNITLQAGADLSAAANQYKIVKLDANGHAILCAAATDVPVGVLQNTPKSGDAADVMVSGVSKVQASAAIAIGKTIGTDASGLAAAYVAGTDTTSYIIGQVLTATAAANGYLTALIDCGAPHRAA